MHANCSESGGHSRVEGVPSDMLDGEMKNKHDILICLELLYHISNKTTVTIVMPQSIYGVVYIIS